MHKESKHKERMGHGQNEYFKTNCMFLLRNSTYFYDSCYLSFILKLTINIVQLMLMIQFTSVCSTPCLLHFNK